jgi:DNA-binding transcriptional LysR family regulator
VGKRSPAAPGLIQSPRALLPNELVAIAAPDHARLGGPPLQPAQLAGETLFLREPGSGTRRPIEAFLAQAGLPLEVGIELGSDNAIKQAVSAGLGIAIISGQAIQLELVVGRLAILPVVGLPLQRQ